MPARVSLLSPLLVGAVGVVLAGLATPADAQLDCIVPTREEGFEPRRPGSEALRRAALEAAAIVQRNRAFMAGNKRVRVRTSISYYGETLPAASVITTAYNERAWEKGGCAVSAFADRGGGLAEGTIAIFINDPDASLQGRLGDAELTAHVAPEPKGQVSGYPVYGAQGDERDPRVLLAAAGYRPWVPVTVADLLALRERELATAEAEWRNVESGSDTGFDEAKIEEIYQSLKQVNPAEAEKMRAQMLAALPKMRSDGERQSAAGAEAISKRRASFDAYRASLTPAQLGAQGYLGNATTPDGITLRVDDPRGTPLVRVDPAYARRDPSRIHLVAVSLAPQPQTDPEYEWHQASLRAVDFGALEALLDR